MDTMFAAAGGGSAQGAATPPSVGEVDDPLGAELGLRRIFRTSPLVEVPSIC